MTLSKSIQVVVLTLQDPWLSCPRVDTSLNVIVIVIIRLRAFELSFRKILSSMRCDSKLFLLATLGESFRFVVSSYRYPRRRRCFGSIFNLMAVGLLATVNRIGWSGGGKDEEALEGFFLDVTQYFERCG